MRLLLLLISVSVFHKSCYSTKVISDPYYGYLIPKGASILAKGISWDETFYRDVNSVLAKNISSCGWNVLNYNDYQFEINANLLKLDDIPIPSKKDLNQLYKKFGIDYYLVSTIVRLSNNTKGNNPLKLEKVGYSGLIKVGFEIYLYNTSTTERVFTQSTITTLSTEPNEFNLIECFAIANLESGAYKMALKKFRKSCQCK